MAPLFEKTPHLPEEARKSIVTVAPWLALIGGVLGLYGTYAGYKMLSLVSSMAYLGITSTWYPATLIALIAMGLAAVLDLLAYKPLTEHKKQGWNLLFYGNTLTTVATILTLLFGYGSNGFGWIIGVVIGYWLLFEVRGAYRG